jgi:addiction module RelE/StbE family toxin
MAKQAKSDLAQIHSYIAETSPLYAEELIDLLLEKAESIDTFPTRGRVVPELRENNVRELISNPYRIIYEIHPDIIVVLGIIHAKRDFDTAFENRTSNF